MLRLEAGVGNVRTSGAREPANLALNSLSLPKRKSYQVAKMKFEGGSLGNTVARREESTSGQKVLVLPSFFHSIPTSYNSTSNAAHSGSPLDSATRLRKPSSLCGYFTKLTKEKGVLELQDRNL